MHRLILSLLLLTCILPDAGAETITDEFKSRVSHLESSISGDLEVLHHAKGEFVAITEYRIAEKTQDLQQILGEAIAQPDADPQYLLSLTQNQLAYVTRTQHYLLSDIKRLRATLGTADDATTLVTLSNRERQLDESYRRELKLLGWGNQLGMAVDTRRAELKELITDRADRLASVVKYTQDQLKAAVDDARNAGKDISAEQTARIVELKARLNQNSLSLSTAIGLLDEMGTDTATLKQTLFEVSGDITQDVLDIDVVSTMLSQWLGAAKAQTVDNGPKVMFKLLVFLLILFGAGLVAKLVKRLVKTAVSNSKLKFSKLLQDFFISLSAKGVYTLGVLIALSQLGFELGPLLAGFGIAGVIIGFALQDTLSNFASGMMILIYRPYDVGDLISAAGVTGRVSHMSLVSTTIKTLDNQRLIIPNNKIWGDTINNITAERHRRVDMTFGISYADNVEHAEQVLKEIVGAHPKVLKDPEFTVRLHLLGESSVDFVVRPWVRPDDYWEVYWDITKAVKQRFDAEGITIPFPQRDVHFFRG
ncbi:mechanosensitive ion channel domain-containing protein [Shewanella sp.]|uniref:mechanosensitive ion channel domain-containing protein n=1 Tax=Shewanella sp. TaxID=50422 RepID=UPI003563DF47